MTPLDIANAEIAKLRRQLAEALDDNRRLRGRDGQEKHDANREKLQSELGLKGTGAAIVYALWRRPGYVAAEALISTCLMDREGSGDELVLMRNHIHRVRQHLGDDSIIARRRLGYRLSDDLRAKVAALLSPK